MQRGCWKLNFEARFPGAPWEEFGWVRQRRRGPGSRATCRRIGYAMPMLAMPWSAARPWPWCEIRWGIRASARRTGICTPGRMTVARGIWRCEPEGRPDRGATPRECGGVPSQHETGGPKAFQSQIRPTNRRDGHATCEPRSESPSTAEFATVFGY